MPNQNSPTRQLFAYAALAVIAVGVVVGIIITRNGGNGDDRKENGAGKNGNDKSPPSADCAGLLIKASKLHSKAEWEEAKKKWEEVTAQCPEFKPLAEDNIRICEQRMRPPEELVPVDKPIGVAKRKPEDLPKISADDLKYSYPKGRVDQHLAIISVDGSGSNVDWALKGSANFQWAAQVLVETEIVENDAAHGKLVVDVTILDDSETLAVSNRTLEVSWPDSPILDGLVKEVDRNLRMIPVYVVVRRIAEVANLVDPNAKRLLTSWSNRYGKDSFDVSGLQLLGKIGARSGAKVRVEYITDWGVKTIQTLNGNVPLTRSDLEQIARSSSPLVDYVFEQSAKTRPGTKSTVEASQIASILGALTFGHEVSGKIEVVREPEDPQKKNIVTLSLLKSRVSLLDENNSSTSRVWMDIKRGTVEYDEKDQLVSQARIEFQGDTKFQSRDHLLFGTENVRNANVKMYYEAQRKNREK